LLCPVWCLNVCSVPFRSVPQSINSRNWMSFLEIGNIFLEIGKMVPIWHWEWGPILAPRDSLKKPWWRLSSVLVWKYSFLNSAFPICFFATLQLSHFKTDWMLFLNMTIINPNKDIMQFNYTYFWYQQDFSILEDLSPIKKLSDLSMYKGIVPYIQ
jgi:hypothetical protein